MTPQLIEKINFIIESFNSKQQPIAKKLILDPSFELQEVFIRNESEIYIKDLKTNETYHFIAFVKSKCNCD